MAASTIANSSKESILRLIEKGVKIPTPESVHIGPEVDLSRISGTGVVIHGGSRISGEKTFIHEGVQIGTEGPVVMENCQAGAHVKLKGGFFQESVFLEKASLGAGSHVREGTICEEYASTAHTVGLKQTILFPFVTLGSLINFCDCLMAGGTGKDNHSEVGSSYIHFNFTPNQDKATPSLIGDVPRGVLLKERPVFLGGQGGMVGPCRLEYGTVVAAGTIVRKDELRPNRLIYGARSAEGNLSLGGRIQQNVKKIVCHNLNYMANLIALKRYYLDVRSCFVGPAFPGALLTGLVEKAAMCLHERIKRLEIFRDKLQEEGAEEKLSGYSLSFYNNWSGIKERVTGFLGHEFTDANHHRFLTSIQKGIGVHGKTYLDVITGLTREEAAAGTAWLEAIVSLVKESATGGMVTHGENRTDESGSRKEG